MFGLKRVGGPYVDRPTLARIRAYKVGSNNSTNLALVFLVAQLELAVRITATVLVHGPEVARLDQGDGEDT